MNRSFLPRDALVADLLDWESLYAAGRLHKPVRVLEKTPESKDPVSCALWLMNASVAPML